MKNSVIKKLLCLLLSAVTVCSCAFSAAAADFGSTPVIYVGEMSENPLYSNPNKNGATVVFDINSSDFTGAMTQIVAGVTLSGLADAETGMTPVLSGIKSLMTPILCASDGNSKDSKIGPWVYNEPISAYKEDEVYNENIKALLSQAGSFTSENETFFFSYDWRLDPLESAQALKEFIDHVETYTRKSKVAVLGVGYGGVIINSYLYEYEEHAASNVSSCVFYNCPILGNAIIGDFMKGRIARVVADESSLSGVIGTINGTDRGEAFFDFIEDDATGLIDGIFENLLGSGEAQKLFGRLFTMLITTIVEAEDGHKTLGKTYNNFALNADSAIYASCLREYLRNMPGLWALVPEKDYAEAVEFLFEDKFIDSELEAKLISYRSVLASTTATLETAQANGINVCVVASYGYQILPVTISLDDMSDGIESLKYASVGAVTTDSSTESGHFNNCVNANHNHVSPDEDIDASYCALPENTWFIKNLPHGDMTNETVAAFVIWLLSGSSQRYVRENSSYTQYLSYSDYAKKLSPYTAPGDDSGSAKYGDVNLDGQITAADARIALRVSVGLETVTKEVRILADVDGDGQIKAADARLILRYSVGLISGFPV